jgi:beta-glucosidase
MGLALSVIQRSPIMGINADLQVGINLANKEKEDFSNHQKEEYKRIFGTAKPETFLEMRSREGDLIIIKAHKAARDAMKELRPELKIGVTLSLHDFQALEGGEENVKKEWLDEFLHYLPYIEKDDFIGIQNYTRKLVGPNGFEPAPKGSERTQMRYEYYPKALENVIRKVSEDLHIPIIVTENGIAAEDDSRRVAFIAEAVTGVAACISSGIPVLGYLHWSLMDNFEWHKGYACTFGLIAVDRKTQQRKPKESLYYLGNINDRGTL